MRYFCKLIGLFVCTVAAQTVYGQDNSGNVTDNSFQDPIVSSSNSQGDSGVELLDEGDCYFLNTGKKKTYYRKKDYFLLVHTENAVSATEMSDQVSANFSNQFEVIQNHGFVGHTLGHLY